ncbi:response regulator transcription factor [Polycladomyces sp. WAk]|uniref:Response regulator transcription factor n=1 Tax=Polycladomyces zharkentensis TaxID=2807616 RepID=A0ABS2WMV8_9BACL|nr:response regulator transcription factor [Polycladomyces sp. WAk]MBN2910893.1 response regulator transcription factor [Polycladomyces sp. WAk]
MTKYLIVPRLQPDEVEQMLDTVHREYHECLTQWYIKLSKINVNNEEKKSLSDVFRFMLDHLDLALSDELLFFNKFEQSLLDWEKILNANRIIFAIGAFEQIMMEMILQNHNRLYVNNCFQWIHALCMNVTSSITQHQLLTFGYQHNKKNRSYSPLIRLLQGQDIWPYVNWEFVAVTTPKSSKHRYGILDIAIYNLEMEEWFPAYQHDDLTLSVHQVISGKTEGFVEKINEKLYLVIKGKKAPLSKRFVQQLVHWMRQAMELSKMYYNEDIHQTIHDQIQQYEAILEFDNTLLSTKGIQDTLSSCVEHICHIAGFQRSALFWYYPFFKKVEGILSYNVPLEEIQRIQEPEHNIPAISKLFDAKRPVHLKRVENLIPTHYIEYFHLTSLLVAPLYGENHRVTGVLLLDQNGRPFEVSDNTIEIVDSLLTRVSRNLHSKLHSNFSVKKTSSLLTNREKQILQLSADGYSTKHIASELHISEYTVNEYISSIFKKLKAKNRTEAVAKALRQHLIQ